MKKEDFATFAAGILCLMGGNNEGMAQRWTQTSAPASYWTCVASSADGTRLIAAQRNQYGGSGAIYTSVDGGVTWLSNNVPNQYWNGVASSADGMKLDE